MNSIGIFWRVKVTQSFVWFIYENAVCGWLSICWELKGTWLYNPASLYSPLLPGQTDLKYFCWKMFKYFLSTHCSPRQVCTSLEHGPAHIHILLWSLHPPGYLILLTHRESVQTWDDQTQQTGLNKYDVYNVWKIFLTIGGEAVIAFMSETATVLFSILSPDRDVYSTIRHVSRVKYSALIKY